MRMLPLSVLDAMTGKTAGTGGCTAIAYLHGGIIPFQHIRIGTGVGHMTGEAEDGIRTRGDRTARCSAGSAPIRATGVMVR